jgi:hypothetical protein
MVTHNQSQKKEKAHVEEYDSQNTLKKFFIFTSAI